VTSPLDFAASSGDTLQLLVGAGNGEPEMLLLLERPGPDGRVTVRSWTSADWSAAPATDVRLAADLLRDVERWTRQRRGLNHELSVVTRWLQKTLSS
jgi:hypothetical protein